MNENGDYDAVDRAKTVDAVQVVRCKDCKYRDAEITVSAPSESQYESFTFASCPCKVFNLGADFFCGKGERKDGDSDGERDQKRQGLCGLSVPGLCQKPML